MMDWLREIVRADRRIRNFVRETPLEHSLPLSGASGSNVYLKLENLQHTGSFKARGAANKILSLGEAERAQGVVAASTGNHGAAVAFAAGALNARSVIFVPGHASRAKIEAMKRLGADVRFHGDDCVIAEAYAREYARAEGMAYVSPYNDPDVVAGQGTVGVEIARVLQRVDRVFVSLGGGGLISGIGLWLKALDPEVHVVGCSPENSCVMIESLQAGRILEMDSRPTLSDGTAGGVEPGAITFELCRDVVDELVLVSEAEIAGAMRSFIESHHLLIEGAAGVALAAQAKAGPIPAGGNDVVVLCGANVSMETLMALRETPRHGADVE
ncbi:MAG: threonine/serine dehydratase [Acidobacteriota bacterium]